MYLNRRVFVMVGAAVLIGRIAAKHLLRDADLVYSTSKIRVYRKFGGERQAFQDFKAVTAKSKVTTLQVWSNLVYSQHFLHRYATTKFGIMIIQWHELFA